MINTYSGITAELYDEWFGKEPFIDQSFYQYLIENNPGPALEIGSGTGRLLLPLLRDGFDVEGLEPSQDMINICLEKAKRMKVEPAIYRQRMELLDIAKKYQTIYIPFCSFQLVVDRLAAFETLKKFYDHLQNNGQLIISLFIPEEDRSQQDMWRIRRTLERDNEKIILSESLKKDRFEQLQREYVKYEIYKDSKLDNTFTSKISLRWYHRYEFQMMLEQAGFKDIEIFGDYNLAEATENTHVYIWKSIRKLMH